MTRFLIATRNEHKLGEIRAILGPKFECWSLKDFPNAPEVVEDAGSFTGNATKKAVELAKWMAASASAAGKVGGGERELFVLADDSGLEVDALSGAPGVNSARFAAVGTGVAGNSSTGANNTKLMGLLKNVAREKRTARFKCVLALTPVLRREVSDSSPVCLADDYEMQTQLFEGVCEGWIGFELRGEGGFGYDPLFFPQGHHRTFGELSEAAKNELSHRARALGMLRKALGG